MRCLLKGKFDNMVPTPNISNSSVTAQIILYVRRSALCVQQKITSIIITRHSVRPSLKPAQAFSDCYHESCIYLNLADRTSATELQLRDKATVSHEKMDHVSVT